MDEIVTENFTFKIIFNPQNITESANTCQLYGSKIAPISTLKKESVYKELVKKLKRKSLQYARTLAHEGQMNDCFCELDLNSAYDDIKSLIVCDKKLKYPTVCFRPNNETNATDVYTNVTSHIDVLTIVLIAFVSFLGVTFCFFILRQVKRVMIREDDILDQVLQIRREINAVSYFENINKLK